MDEGQRDAVGGQTGFVTGHAHAPSHAHPRMISHPPFTFTLALAFTLTFTLTFTLIRTQTPHLDQASSPRFTSPSTPLHPGKPCRSFSAPLPRRAPARNFREQSAHKRTATATRRHPPR
ncbi:hypothetical protein PMIN01_08706 [Paraphaeosphaeria minitans]|uniref:Uncharacterized protein n=1 Tax=Paraphaeosphaeria minitans TaxID=565426 RepID=A0A9P6GF41_9PLEO|nr:hypothetical protein PMIN01_08706 [Paraphaeosphaeria minitans]